MLQGTREKRNHIYREKKIQIAVDFTSKTMEIKRKCFANNTRKDPLTKKILAPIKIPYRKEREIRHSKKKDHQETFHQQLTLKEQLKDIS